WPRGRVTRPHHAPVSPPRVFSCPSEARVPQILGGEGQACSSIPGKLFTYLTVRPSAAPLVPQPANPHVRRLSVCASTSPPLNSGECANCFSMARSFLSQLSVCCDIDLRDIPSTRRRCCAPALPPVPRLSPQGTPAAR